MSQSWRWGLGLALAALVLAGCGGSSGAPPAAEEEGAAALPAGELGAQRTEEEQAAAVEEPLASDDEVAAGGDEARSEQAVEDVEEAEEPPPASASAHPDAGETVRLGGDRVARLRVPASYDGETGRPLLMLLHGYTSNSGQQDSYMGFSRRVNSDEFFLLLPEGRRDVTGQQFWNATDACCDIYGAGGDDVGYLVGLIEEAQAAYAIDAERVFVVGHSNGGFMAYRLACEGAPLAAIVSLAGSEWAEESICDGAPALRVLQIHGDRDLVIPFEGVARLGPGLGGFPSAREVVERWAARGGCEGVGDAGPRRDLDRFLPGVDTDVLIFDAGCRAGGGAELWTIVGGGHVPALEGSFALQVLAWLLAG